MPATPLDPYQVPRSQQYTASGIGSIAHECLRPESVGIVQGVTSRGIFIKTSTRWIIFVSYEPYPGPLTINVPGFRDAGINLEPGEQVEIASGKVTFSGADLLINTQNLNTWQPRPLSTHPLPVPERQQRLVTASKRVIGKDTSIGLSGVLPYLMPIPEITQIEIERFPPYFEQILMLCGDSQNLPSPAALIDLLGSGPGLTPTGDDFVIGLLLAINRWGHILPTPMNLDHYNQQIVAAAYQNTTTLSANLVECATRGLADQRLIDALDWLVSGTQEGVNAIDELLSWGNSSGSDAFAGFVAALSSRKITQQADSR